jgi:hypothetical protein
MAFKSSIKQLQSSFIRAVNRSETCTGVILPVKYLYKPGDRLVLYTVNDTPVEGTVRWVGHVAKLDGQFMPVVGVETDKRVDVEKDFFNLHINAKDGNGRDLFRVSHNHSRVFVPEAFFIPVTDNAESTKDVCVVKAPQLGMAYGALKEQQDGMPTAGGTYSYGNQNTHNSEIQAPNRQRSITEPLPNPHYAIGLGSIVLIPTQGGYPLRGVVRWIGALPDCIGTFGGVELDYEYPGCTDGTWNGGRFFNCPHERAYFCPLNSLQLNNPTLEQVASHERQPIQNRTYI